LDNEFKNEENEKDKRIKELEDKVKQYEEQLKFFQNQTIIKASCIIDSDNEDDDELEKN
jgi:hypothetical protein